MKLPFAYSYLFVVVVASALLICFLVWLHRRLGATRVAEVPLPTQIHDVREHEFYTEYLMPLLVFEKNYPSFIAILSLVISRFPISRFTVQPEIRSALAFLRDASFKGGEDRQIASVMCVVVNAFVNDPDVEYDLRLQLPDLLNKFLEEVSRIPHQAASL